MDLENMLAEKEEELRINSKLLAAFLAHFPGLVFWKDTNFVYQGGNEWFSKIVGLNGPEELVGKTDFELDWTKEEAELFRKVDERIIASGEEDVHRQEKLTQSDGTVFWFDTTKVPLKNKEGEVTGVLGLATDITKWIKSESRIKDLMYQLKIKKKYAQANAITDRLTQLPNRARFDEALNTSFFRLKRSGGSLSLIMIDIDFFKKYNDLYGHVVGDDCLRKVASAFKSVVHRAPDLVARYGGEEFVAILPDTLIEDAASIAEKLRLAVESLAIPHDDSSASHFVTVSLGVVSVIPKYVGIPEQVVQLADNALYIAKTAGRNRVSVLTPWEQPGAGGIRMGESRLESPLVWHKNDECGNETIDEQHRRLFELCNNLLFVMKSDFPSRKREGVKVLDALLNDISIHFGDEEHIIDAAGFPFVEDHAKSHTALIEDALSIITRFKADEVTFEHVFAFLVYEVVVQHIFLEDRKYFAYLLNPQ